MRNCVPNSCTVTFVGNRSAVGEQYLDLQPRSDTGPYLRDGSTIARADTRIPLPATTLIVSLDRLVRSVPKKDLRITVDEQHLRIGFHQVGVNSLAQSRFDLVTVELASHTMIAN